jgi:hypothetical protein
MRTSRRWPPRTAVLVLAALGLAAVVALPSAPTHRHSLADVAGARRISPEALSFLEEALEVMETQALTRAQVDWPGLAARMVARAGMAQTPSDTYDAIRSALRDLNDRHSFLTTPSPPTPAVEESGPARPDRRERGEEGPEPAGRWLEEDRIAYVLVPSHMGTAAQDAEYSRRLLEIVGGLDARGPRGWVVDLRRNPGGNMWPMLAGIGPVVGEGKLGEFVHPGDARLEWGYRDGKAYLGPMVQAAGPRSLRLKEPDPFVAVLTGPMTASSGEAVAVAFRGRPRTRSFGAGTAGMSSSTFPYPLRDGATIYLTVSEDADRGGFVYGGTIEPDEPVAEEEGRDAPLAAAVAWLKKCAGESRQSSLEDPRHPDR